MPGSGKLTLTGQLGDVMRESAQAALSYVRAPRGRYGPAGGLVRRARHPPARARRARSPRTARRAGITMATALVSLLTGRPVRADVAMTGEITLTGQVLPIGGLKEKALAAQRSGRQARARARAQRGRPRGHPRAAAQGPRVRLGVRDRRGAATPALGTRVRTAGRGRLRNTDPTEERYMASKKKKAAAAAGGAAGAAKAAKNNPYVQEIVDDDELRDNIQQAYESARDGLRPARARQEAGQGDLRRQEAAERPQDGGGLDPRRGPAPCATRPGRLPRRRAAAASFRKLLLSPSPPASRWRCRRICARRCSTRCSAPRRSSSTRRRPRSANGGGATGAGHRRDRLLATRR